MTRPIALLASVSLLISGCATSVGASPPPDSSAVRQVSLPADPCAATEYVRLQRVDLASMTDREFEYFVAKDAACSDMDTPAEERSALGMFRAGTAIAASVVISVVGGLLLGILLSSD